jgi:hypothetical protein
LLPSIVFLPQGTDAIMGSTISNRRAARSFWMALGAVALLAVTGDVHTRADATGTRADADGMQRKIDQIAALPRGAGRRVKLTPFTEREVNAYIRFRLRDQIPSGIADPAITIVGDGRVSGRAIVDLDEVSRANRSTSWFDPMRLLSGRLPVVAAGVLETRNGEGRFVLETATVSGVPVPKSVLQRVVSYYSTTPEDPDGIGLDDAFALPAQIVEIRVQAGQALVVQ